MANRAFRSLDFGAAMRGYISALSQSPGLKRVIRQNMVMTADRFRSSRIDDRLRVGVCGWSLTHNAAGRAHALARLWQEFADVEIVGALFPRYGEGVWAPIRDSGVVVHAFRVDSQRQFMARALELVASHPYDLVHLAKPRMPNLIFGLLYKLLWGARVIVDIDDNERAFARRGRSDRPDVDPARIGVLPYPDRLAAPKWTEVAQNLVPLFDGVTVSNPVLQNWFGGTIVRHARSERDFDPDRMDRALAREKFELPLKNRIVLFLGTPRAHKGLVEAARALAALRRDDVSFLVVGRFDADASPVRKELEAVQGLDIHFMDDQPFSAVPTLVAAADVCLALQHLDSDVSGAQVPAKLSDAMAMGRPAVVTRNPALADLPLDGVVLQTDMDDLPAVLAEALSDDWHNEERRQRIREAFLEELSVGANAARLRELSGKLEERDDERLARYMHRVLTHFPGFTEGLLDSPGTQARSNGGRGLADQRLDEILAADCPSGLREALEASDVGIVRAERRLDDLTDKPLVSVVMPTHNRAAILAEAIQSVVEQSYDNWELLVCDDASTDATAEVVAQFDDPRIHYLKLEKQGAAAARNRGLELARGELVAYLDSDNMWRRGFLARAVCALEEYPGRSCVYANYLDYRVDRHGTIRIKAFERPRFHHERLLDKNYIDLNSFVHRRELYDSFGGFTESLPRRQDYDLIIKYTWLRDPLYVDDIVTLYQRNENLDQLTVTAKHQNPLVEQIVDGNVAGYLANGLPQVDSPVVQRVTVISWDMSRNHFSKAFAVAEALSRDYDVQLVSFRFFEEEIFPPLAGVKPPFETVYLPGNEFPDFFDAMRRALARISGDVIYVVKPRLPSLGLALLARHVYGTPIVLEINDLESVVQAPGRDKADEALPLDQARPGDPELNNPHSHRWSLLMEWLARQLPVLTTHNGNIDAHFGHRCLYMRNPKDEHVYDPARWDRDSIRRDLGFAKSDRVILFGGLIRKHKGIYELVELVDRLGDSRYKLLFVGSRISPDQKRLVAEHGERITVLPPQDREAMARINLAADLVVLWLDPDVPASHYQMPYKATDAFAMGASIIANDISDLGELARQGYLYLVPFGDWNAMEQTIHRIFADRKQRRARQKAGQRLFRRQFSYTAMRSGFELAARRAVKENEAQAAVAEQFHEFFINGCGQRSLIGEGFGLPGNVSDVLTAAITAITPKMLDEPEILADLPGDGVVAVVLAAHRGRGLAAARRLVARAGHPLKVLVVKLEANDQTVPTLHKLASVVSCHDLVVTSEGILTGVDWLGKALVVAQASDSKVLALNGGQTLEQSAPCLMIRRSWLQSLELDLWAADELSGWLNAVQQRARQDKEFANAPEAVVYDLGSAELELARFEPEQTEYTPSPGWFERVRDRVARMLGLGWQQVKSVPDIDEVGSSAWNRLGADITLVDGDRLRQLVPGNSEEVAVIMPAINRRQALATARHLACRAGMPVRIIVVVDSKRRGFVDTLNRTAQRIAARYVVYLAEDAVAGENWLKIAHASLEATGKGLLAFNCGKWHGRIAAFGMVRVDWVSRLYGGEILHGGYRAHRADNELTAIARATDEFVYCPEAVLLENDPGKLVLDIGVEQSHRVDRRLFRQRYAKAFNGLASPEALDALQGEYIAPDRSRLKS